MTTLSFYDHSRFFANYQYVYPVLSRRAQGLSIGVNLNTNNACNWRCIYCQVDNLKRGAPTSVDLAKIEFELDQMLDQIMNGNFLESITPKELARFNDISLSGNGESTQSHQFLDVVKIITKLKREYNITNQVKTILISNGSEVIRDDIAQALQLINQDNGEVWFKLDSATQAGMLHTNQINISSETVYKRIITTCTHCKTYIQTCMFRFDNIDPSDEEINHYLHMLKRIKNQIAGVLLYSVARVPALPEGAKVSSVSLEFLANLAKQIEAFGIEVKYYQ